MSEQYIDSTEASATQRRARRRVLVSVVGWTAVVLYFAAAGVILAMRYWVLPNIDRYASDVEQMVSRSLGERVTIGAIRAGWQGLRPELALTDVRIYDRAGRIALSLPTVDAVVSWRSLGFGSLRFHSLAFEQPNLEIRRDSAGRLYIAGVELKRDAASPDFSLWLLSQREVVIRNAALTWDDEQRAAPQLRLAGVGILLRNSGSLHRFALRAQVSAELASALDVRGELRGEDVEELQNWTGRLFAELDYTDLAAWQRWVDYPFEIRSGKGAMRLWLGFSGKRLTEAVADVALAQVAMRLSSELPLLELNYLQGRLGGKQSQTGFELFAKRLSLKSGGEVALPPADFDVRWQEAGPAKPQRGELGANSLELEPLARLAEYLPLPRELRKSLAELAPRGSVSDLTLAWEGEADRPQRYSLRGRFANLGMRAGQYAPGFSGASGQLDASEKGGNLSLGAQKAVIELPNILPEDRLQFDTLSGQVAWNFGRDGVEFRFSNVALANREVAGVLFGSFATRPDSPGVIDLSGNFSRADAKSVYKHIPFLPAAVREYLKSAVQSGQAYDVRLRLKGDMRYFPFDDPQQGSFQVSGKLNGVDFGYAPAWPRLEGVTGELVFEGRQMHVFASRASIFGVRVANVKAGIQDLFNGNEALAIDGQADGPTSEFLRFVDASPVTRYIGGFTEDMRATGSGRLQLRLDLPLRRLQQSKVAGSYQLVSNQVTIDPGIPPLAQVNGRVDFTEAGISARNLTSQFLGGATTISVATQSDGTVSINSQGTAAISALRRFVDLPLQERVSGSAAWRGNLAIKGKVFDLSVESSLQGVGVDLPPPMKKSAGETMLLRLVRTNNPQSEILRRLQLQRLPSRGDVLAVSIGSSINGAVVRVRDGDQMVVERGALGLNERPPALDRPGIAIAGTLPYIDLDDWRFLLHGNDQASTMPISVNMHIAEVDVSGKRINDLTLRANRAGANWSAAVNAQELAGDITWRPEGQGRIVARLRHFTVPGASPTAPAQDSHPSSELPALDIVADDFTLGARKLGKLELVAVNQARDWHIERLVLSAPESTTSAEGYWQSWAARPSTSVNVKLDVKDVGKYLDRMGFPGTMRGGSAHLEGKLAWAGSPQDIDYPTLTGNVTLKVEKGQFLKADPGVAKLLGIVSLQSLLTFDLRDLFREGFAFDTISATASITKGVLDTKDFDMHGAAARVNMTGDIDLAHETQTLRMRVVPALGESAATAATLLLKINPVTGLGALIAQRILKDPLGQIFALEYSVTGSWAQPKVERAKVEARESGDQ